jgi:undecaprenyl-diphosphatase
MDQKLFLLINTVWTNPALDRLMAVASSFDLWMPFILGVVLVAAWRGGFRARSFLVAAILTAAICDGVVSNSLKHLVNRPRPADTLAGVRQVDLAGATPRFVALVKRMKVRLSREPSRDNPPPGRSFPSSHTANTCAVATVAALFYRRRGWLAFGPALLVAYSRIYTGAHWPSDVAGSIVLGLAVGVAGVLLAEKVWDRWGARLLPAIAASHPRLPSARPAATQS